MPWIILKSSLLAYELWLEKTCVLYFQPRHKSDCRVTEATKILESFDIETIDRFYWLDSEKQRGTQLRFPHDMAHM